MSSWTNARYGGITQDAFAAVVALPPEGAPGGVDIKMASSTALANLVEIMMTELNELAIEPARTLSLYLDPASKSLKLIASLLPVLVLS